MSDASLKGRVVLITGGARGLGREMALALAGVGARLCITGACASPALQETERDLVNLTGKGDVLAIASDVADPAAAQATVAQCIGRFDRLDVLVNNAGRGMRLISETFNTVPTKFWEADPDAWRKIIDINVNGPFLMTAAAIPQMLRQGFGKVVNISTSDQTMVRKGYAPYGPSKAALEAASRIWAQDLAGTGVDLNVLLPGGAADTDLLPPSPDKKGADGNLLPPDIMNESILWLASNASNGQTGGRYIGRLWDGPDAARGPSVPKPRIM